MKKVKTALISVYNKSGIENLASLLHEKGVEIISTGGTQRYLEEHDIPVTSVESLTDYPSILDGRVKTLHPVIFGGILARREEKHLDELQKYNMSPIDMVVVDLYPFEKTVRETDDETAIIEKIDIGGIALIRAAAKNYKDLLIVPSRNEYEDVFQVLKENDMSTGETYRKQMAEKAFSVSSHYDNAIKSYLGGGKDSSDLQEMPLRYGENPHQSGTFYGDFKQIFEKLNGGDLSYNNFVDVDAAWSVIKEFSDDKPACAVLKHTNTCGLAVRDTVSEAWKDALAGDPVSAFGGIIIFNCAVDLETARQIDEIFYSVLIAPEYKEDALEQLKKKKKRIILRLKSTEGPRMNSKTVLNGTLVQEYDQRSVKKDDLKVVTNKKPSEQEIRDMIFANKVVKHLKSNAIALVKNEQLLGGGNGQTSRVDALKQAIHKAKSFDFNLDGAIMASDAFFPFPDCVEIADMAGIKAVIQPGGSIKDQKSIDYCDAHEMTMVMTSIRHFKH